MNKERMDKNPILKLPFEFAFEIIRFCEEPQTQKKFVIAQQLLKSGTPICVNAIAAQNPESKADFIHKFKVAAKEGEKLSIFCFYAIYHGAVPLQTSASKSRNYQ